jgi:hypothetical protein
MHWPNLPGILVFVDGAANHGGGNLVIPANIKLAFLLLLAGAQPAGKSLGELREKTFKNYALKSMDDVYDKLEEAALYLKRNPELVKSITSFPYIAKSI